MKKKETKKKFAVVLSNIEIRFRFSFSSWWNRSFRFLSLSLTPNRCSFFSLRNLQNHFRQTSICKSWGIVIDDQSHDEGQATKNIILLATKKPLTEEDRFTIMHRRSNSKISERRNSKHFRSEQNPNQYCVGDWLPSNNGKLQVDYDRSRNSSKLHVNLIQRLKFCKHDYATQIDFVFVEKS